MPKFDTLFLDRDGVINKKLEGRYVRDWEEFEFMPKACFALSELSKKFERIIIITNQQGIGKGIMSKDDLHFLHQKMTDEIEKKGGKMRLGIEEIKRDMLKMMDKLDDHEQMFINLQRKHIDDYKLINDRITELFDIIKMLEKEER